MKVDCLHGWGVTTVEAKAIQQRLAGRVRLEPLEVDKVRLVAAVDVSSSRFSRFAHAAAVVFDVDSMAMVDSASAGVEVSFPYVPGYLSFREGPAVVAAWKQLNTEPHAVLFDGQGLAHPRRFGLACHLGLWLGLPSIGIAKNRLVGEYQDPGWKKGSVSPLMDGSEQIGAVLRSRDNVKPLFVSAGHLTDLDSALALTLRCLGAYRLPEPSRAAHRECNKARKAFGQ